jgi:hypothetical protein
LSKAGKTSHRSLHMQLPGHNKGPFQSLIMNLKRESLPKKWEVLDQEEDLLEEGVAPVIEACEPQSGALEASDDNGAQKSHLKTAIEPKDSERPSGLAPASQRQHTSSPLEPQKTQEACYLTDDDDKTRAEDAIDADRTFETIDQRSGGIDVSSYQSVAHKPQKRASASLPSNKRPAKLIKVEFKMPVQGNTLSFSTVFFQKSLFLGVSYSLLSVFFVLLCLMRPTNILIVSSFQVDPQIRLLIHVIIRNQ